LNRAGFAGGSHFQIGWSHDEQDDQQILVGSSRPRGADGFGSRGRSRHTLGGGVVCGVEDRLHGVIRGKPVRTTISDKAAPCPLDRVNRQFKAPAPNRLWVSDFTCVSTWGGMV
jgi:transposase InsO family protein